MDGLLAGGSDHEERVRSSAFKRNRRCYAARVRFRPDLRIDRVERLTPAVLAERGLSGLLLDLDETLVTSASLRPSRAVRTWSAELAAAGIRMAILSNGTPRRVAYVAGALGVEGLSLIGKPWSPAFRRGLAALDLPAGQVAMVGDQLFTDVLGARACGLRTVLVQPLSAGGLPHTRALRHVENWLIGRGDHGRPVHR